MLNIRLPKLRKPGILREEHGFTLIEVLVAVLLLATLTAALATGFVTASKVLLRNDVRQIAQNLAAYEMEAVKNQPYQEVATPAYAVAAIPSPQTTIYTATITATNGTDATAFNPSASPSQARDIKLQKITVKIFKSGSLIYTLDGYKVE
jgi:prepilin-type N-terminal cleavage/methylation domain-containing protein